MYSMQPSLAFFQNIGATEMIVVGVIALLIFGRRLPEVGRSLGKSFVEFKKGLKDTGDEIKEIRSEVHKSGNDDGKSSEQPANFNDPKDSDAKARQDQSS